MARSVSSPHAGLPEMRASTLGMLESRSLARGLVALDACLKEAEVELLWSRAIEPGRHLFLLTGEVDAVRSALGRGRTVLGSERADELFLARVHPAVLVAARGAQPVTSEVAALGVIECSTVSAGLLAADAAVKMAEVGLHAVKVEGGMGGKSLVILTGETADVESAVGAGASVAEEHAALVRVETIDAPSPELLPSATML